MYRYISRESCSQFDSLPLTSLLRHSQAELHRKQPAGSAAARAPTPLMLCRVVLAHFKNGPFTRGDVEEFLVGEAPEVWSARVGLDVGDDFWAEARPLARIALHALTAGGGERM